MRQIAIYGKGGIGKSTVAANLSMAFRRQGLRVMQVGCDPKRDSTRTLTGGRLIPTVLETYRDELRIGHDAYAIELEQIVYEGREGILCVESGGPEPGVGCAGRGVLTAMQILRDLKAFGVYSLDVVLYDVLGDVVCGGFAQPIRQGYAREIYLVCSGEFMSLYAANNIARAIARLGHSDGAGLAGLICNSRGDEELERGVLTAFAERLGSRLIHLIPRSSEIQLCELRRRTVVEGARDSAAAQAFRQLAAKVWENRSHVIPTPIEDLAGLEALYADFVRESPEEAAALDSAWDG
jgi:nitrogenase iron protein NifH